MNDHSEPSNSPLPKSPPAPRRVVSLLPSATEIVGLLGAQDRLVGRSHECDWPAGLEHLPVLTGQKTNYEPSSPNASREVDRQVREALVGDDAASLYHLDTERLRELRPDLILTQDLCEVCSIDLNTVRGAARQIAEKTGSEPEVVSLNPDTFEAVFDDILTVGAALGLTDRAERVLVELRERYYRACDFVTTFGPIQTVLFLEWTDPVFCAGHWTPQLIERAGGSHPLNPTEPVPGSGQGIGPQQAYRKAGKSVQVPIEAIEAVERATESGAGGWERVIICPCGLTLEQARAEAHKLLSQPWFSALQAVQRDNVAIVDGNQMFNRPGPRLVDAFEWLVGWLNDRPESIPVGFPWQCGLRAASSE
ncbi:MAG: ABC transporter substrate-binding protein [Phycisphaerales bacterium]